MIRMPFRNLIDRVNEVARQPPEALGFSRSKAPVGETRAPDSAINRLALSRMVTFSGGNAAYIALLLILFRETGSPTVVAIGALASFAVPAIASPLAGWIGDRFDRRTVMMISETLGAFCFLLMAIFSASPSALLLLRAVASLVASPMVPATAAALPKIVDTPEELLAANAKLAVAGISGGLVGPFIGGLLMLAGGAASVFLFNTVTFVVSAAVLFSIKGDFRPAPAAVVRSHAAELAIGFRFLWSNDLLRPITVAYGATFAGVGVTVPAEVVVASEFGVGAIGLAALTCVFAVGGICGSRLTKSALGILGANPMYALGGASGILGLGFLTVAVAPSFPLVLAGMTMAGVAVGAWTVLHEHIVQRLSPDAIRSRVFAGGEALYFSALSAGLVGAGGLMGRIGAAGIFQLGMIGAVCGVVVLATSQAFRSRGYGRQSVGHP